MKKILPYCLITLLLACSKKHTSFSGANVSRVQKQSSETKHAAQEIAPTPSSVSQSKVTPVQRDYYQEAYLQLNGMLKGSVPLSFKKAVFYTENAYMDNKMNYKGFNGKIKVLANLCKSIGASRKLIYDGEDKERVKVYASVFSVMTDTFPILLSDTLVNHNPFQYDFNDFWGNQNWEQMFVSKLLVTKRGNCHSLPYLYKILVEELGEKAYLSIAPNHVYIKLQNSKSGWYNTELTSGIFPNDAWLMASGYIHLEAIRNGLYLDTLSQKQSIAMCMIDLAQGFEKKNGVNDGKFILKACETALKYYPNYINALLLRAETRQKLFAQMMEKQGVKYPSQMFYNPKAKALFDQMEKDYARIHKLGYRKMPERMYTDWLLSLKENRDKYENRKITNFVKNN